MHPEISIRYTNEKLLQIYKTLGRFEHPLDCASSFGLDEEDPQTQFLFETMTYSKPDVVLELVRDDIERSQLQPTQRQTP